jgi:ATP-binding protein involved in chromosome partitioning
MNRTMSTLENDARHALARVIDPHTGLDMVSSRQIKKLSVDNKRLKLNLELGYPARSQIEVLRSTVLQALAAVAGFEAIELEITTHIVAHAVQRGLALLPNIKNVVAVASGKGGVGKSTTAVNLALALAAEGAQVGLLDADIYGPSLPMMMGVSGKPAVSEQKTMQPLVNHGVQVMSMGFLVEADTAMIWRGPMATQALDQLLRQTSWADLDYLIVDMPPGTGDIQLTLSQRVPLAGAVIVTTPQDIALLDARKAIRMFEKVSVPLLGLVENMAVHVCSNCGHAEHIFGADGALALAQQVGIDHLGALPLDLSIRVDADRGVPSVVSAPDGEVGILYKTIARRLTARMALRAQDFSAKFPKISISSST